MSGRKARWSRRRKLWVAISLTVLGTGALTALAMFVQDARDTDQDDPTRGLTSRAREVDTSALPPIRFTEVGVAWGLDVIPSPGPRGRTLPEDTGCGIACGDYDGDGDPDLYLVGFPGPLKISDGRVTSEGAGRAYLFRNDGDRFTDVTESAGVANLGGFGMGARFADYDADGDLDLYVANFGPNRLYRNRGNGTFEEVAAASGVDAPGWSTALAWGDYDQDGHLDLYVGSYIDYDLASMGPALDIDMGGSGYQVPFALNPNGFDPAPNHLFRNLGDGTFEAVAVDAGVANEDGRTLGATFCDLDGDGWLDLYVNNDVSPNRLYRNMGELGRPVRFVDLSTLSGSADPRGSMGLSVAEVGQLSDQFDGLPDLFISHWVAQENAIYLSVRTPGGGLEYRDRTRQVGLGELSLDTVGWGSAFIDLDRDGRLDLLVANGSTLEQTKDPTRLVDHRISVFWNAGARFIECAARCGPALARRHSARGLATLDFDGDGDQDVVVSINRGRPLLLRNDTESEHHGLSISLAGPATACFGARVEITTTDPDGASRKQIQWYAADASFLSDHARDLHFGLGTATAATRVSVRFADGQEVARENVAAGHVVIQHKRP